MDGERIEKLFISLVGIRRSCGSGALGRGRRRRRTYWIDAATGAVGLPPPELVRPHTRCAHALFASPPARTAHMRPATATTTLLGSLNVCNPFQSGY